MFASTTTSSGKTLLTSAICHLLTEKGLKILPAKVGPDFIDPQYLEIAAKNPAINLDCVMTNPDIIPAMINLYGSNKDLVVIEGVMGLFDGTYLINQPDSNIAAASSAHISYITKTPVILIVDANKKAQSISAEIKGFFNHSKKIKLSGIIVNNISSESHFNIIKQALKPYRDLVLGYVFKNPEFAFTNRYLGLYAPRENPKVVRNKIKYISQEIAKSIDLERLLQIASSAPNYLSSKSIKRLTSPIKFNLAFFRSKPFSFYYHSTISTFEHIGAQINYVDPLIDTQLPKDTQAIYIPGGYPELYVDDLIQNKSLLKQIKHLYLKKVPIWAECGGMMYLAKNLNGKKLAGVLNTKLKMGKKLNVGYRRAKLLKENPLGKKNTAFFAHEHHYFNADPPGNDIEVKSATAVNYIGFLNDNLFASFLHLELTDNLNLAVNFARKAKGTKCMTMT